MPIYEKSTKELMHEFAKAVLKPGQLFKRQEAVKWFAQHYKKIKSTTVTLHVGGMTTNNSAIRKHNPQIRPGSGWDLFFKVGPGRYRLWNPAEDPAPEYAVAGNLSPTINKDDEDSELEENGNGEPSGSEFAYERDLKNYLAKNLTRIEQGLQLYQDEGFTGLEFPVGGRFIDILATDIAGSFVVIELKVSRGYDRTIGQLLRYMAWVKKHLADGRRVRGIIIASDISEDLKLASSLISDVATIEYALELQLKPVTEHLETVVAT